MSGIILLISWLISYNDKSNLFFPFSDVTYDWLACLPISARMHVYDVFFLRGQAIEVVNKLVPCLQWRGSSDDDTRTVHSNAER